MLVLIALSSNREIFFDQINFSLKMCNNSKHKHSAGNFHIMKHSAKVAAEVTAVYRPLKN